MGIVLLTSAPGARENIEIYKKTECATGWDQTPYDILIGQHMCICETDYEARAYLQEGCNYFFGVLGGGVRTAANLVLKESRFYENAQRRAAVSQRRRDLAAE